MRPFGPSGRRARHVAVGALTAAMAGAIVIAFAPSGWGALRPQAAAGATVSTFATGVSEDAAGFVASINQVRASKGLPALAVDTDLMRIAAAWSSQMASQQTLYHNAQLASQLPPDWLSAGENVGVGPAEPDIARAFINSPEHYANIVKPGYTDVGVSVIYGSDGRLWVTEDFASFSHRTPPATTSSPVTAAPSTAPPATAPHATVRPTTVSPTTMPPKAPSATQRSLPSTTTPLTPTVPPPSGPPTTAIDLPSVVAGLKELQANS